MRRALARSRGVQIGRGVIIGRNVEFRFSQSPYIPRRIKICDNVKIDSGSILDCYGGMIEIGNDTIVGPGCVLYGHGGLSIGKECLISPHCLIYSSNHGIPGPELGIRHTADTLARTSIGDDCWLGSGTSVMAGVTINRGVVVGAGSVVTKDIAAFALANGIPAKVRGFRQSVDGPDDAASDL